MVTTRPQQTFSKDGARPSALTAYVALKRNNHKACAHLPEGKYRVTGLWVSITSSLCTCRAEKGQSYATLRSSVSRQNYGIANNSNRRQRKTRVQHGPVLPLVNIAALFFPSARKRCPVPLANTHGSQENFFVTRGHAPTGAPAGPFCPAIDLGKYCQPSPAPHPWKKRLKSPNVNIPSPLLTPGHATTDNTSANTAENPTDCHRIVRVIPYRTFPILYRYVYLAINETSPLKTGNHKVFRWNLLLKICNIFRPTNEPDDCALQSALGKTSQTWQYFWVLSLGKLSRATTTAVTSVKNSATLPNLGPLSTSRPQTSEQIPSAVYDPVTVPARRKDRQTSEEIVGLRENNRSMPPGVPAARWNVEPGLFCFKAAGAFTDVSKQG
ncbi:hypothetical protein Bbelb_348950 [Branchiostoma belcheri]|nr:hypothetical protein Bbelb_348950 [Branchiostoma belcheri]